MFSLLLHWRRSLSGVKYLKLLFLSKKCKNKLLKYFKSRAAKVSWWGQEMAEGSCRAMKIYWMKSDVMSGNGDENIFIDQCWRYQLITVIIKLNINGKKFQTIRLKLIVNVGNTSQRFFHLVKHNSPSTLGTEFPPCFALLCFSHSSYLCVSLNRYGIMVA